MKPLYQASILTLPIIFTACMSTPKDITPIEYYTPPQASNQTATIVGDIYERKYVADTIAYVFAVDQKKILNGRENLNNPLLLTTGEHELQIWCGRGGYKYTNLVKANIEANKKYQVGYELNPNKQQGCVFWINDLDTKKPIAKFLIIYHNRSYGILNRF